jgi:hypothetical protein
LLFSGRKISKPTKCGYYPVNFFNLNKMMLLFSGQKILKQTKCVYFSGGAWLQRHADHLLHAGADPGDQDGPAGDDQEGFQGHPRRPV